MPKMTCITIEDTKPELKRDPSSGVFKKDDFEEISFGGSATTENAKKMVEETFNSMWDGVRGVGIAKGWIPDIDEKHIFIEHGDTKHILEVSTVKSRESLIQAVQQEFGLALEIKLLYSMEGGKPVVVTDVKDLRSNVTYSALAGFETLPAEQTASLATIFTPEMEEFFEKLKSDQELDDDDVYLIKECFGKHKIIFNMTDEKLERIGISQLGLRTAILDVIKKFCIMN